MSVPQAISREYLDRRNRVILYLQFAIFSLNLYWGWSFFSVNLLVGAVQAFIGISSIVLIVYLRVTKNIERTFYLGVVQLFIFLVIDILGYDNGQFFYLGCIALLTSAMMIKGVRGMLVVFVGFLPVLLFSVLYFPTELRYLKLLAAEGSFLDPLLYATSLYLLVPFASLSRIIESDKEEVSARNRELFELNKQVADKVSQRKKYQADLAKKAEELSRLRSYLDK